MRDSFSPCRSTAGRSRIQSIIASAGLPLEIADDESQEENVSNSSQLHTALSFLGQRQPILTSYLQGPLSPFTEAYAARGWFTGVRSTVTIPQSADVVYRSLAADLHKVFTPMTVRC